MTEPPIGDRTFTTPNFQQVWGIRYIDELICRDYTNPVSSASRSSSSSAAPAPPARIYVAQDANFNVTALLDASATVLQRFRYEPYGQSTVLSAAWNPTTDSYAWNWRHQGLYRDVETGIIYNRMRYLHPLLGRFLQRDPIEHIGGVNFYELIRSYPTFATDPLGLERVMYNPRYNCG